MPFNFLERAIFSYALGTKCANFNKENIVEHDLRNAVYNFLLAFYCNISCNFCLRHSTALSDSDGMVLFVELGRLHL